MSATSPPLPSKILIFGATGAIGRYITDSILSSSPAVAPGGVAIFTSPTTPATSNPAKQELLSRWRQARSDDGSAAAAVEVIEGDVTSAADVAAAYASTGADTVVSCLGRDALPAQPQLLRLAAAAPGSSVRWFLPSEYGTDVEYDATSAAEAPHQHKLRLRELARADPACRSLPCTYVVTGPYADMFLTPKPAPAAPAGCWDVPARRAVLIGGPGTRIGFTTMPDVGRFVVEALRHPEASMGRAVKVQSFVATQGEILAEFERQTAGIGGGGKWEVETTSLDELERLEKSRWDTDDPFKTVFTLRRIWASGRTLYEKTDNEALGLGPADTESLSTAVARAIKAQTA